MKPLLKVSLLIVFVISSLDLLAQKKAKVYMSMDYTQLVNEYNLVEVTVRTRIDGKFSPIPNIPIQIKMDNEDGDTLLATINSDEKGYASLAIKRNYHFYKDEEGQYILHAIFNGNETYKKATKKEKIKDLQINADFSIVDSTKVISLNAYEIINDSLFTPDKEIDFEIYIKRMFANLKVAESKFVDGRGSAIFPSGIPGDKKGNITIIIKVDNRDYNIVELTKNIHWGSPLVIEENNRKNTATISYVVFMIVSAIIIATAGIFLNKTINHKS